MKIYKYPVPIVEEFTLEMPAAPVLLSVQAQRNEAQLWAMVDPAAPTEKVRFRLLGTGHDFDSAEVRQYVGTFQVDGGAFVFHLFLAPEKTHA